MRRRRLRTIFLALIILWQYFHCWALHCDRKPKGATGSQAAVGTKFRIIIDPNSAYYSPNHTYLVSVQGSNSVLQNPNLFNGFSLTVEPYFEENRDPAIGPEAAGLFQLTGDANTKIDENCPNMVVHTSHIFVPKIEASWISPGSGAGTGCVIFKAAVMEQNIWYMDDGGLSYKLCENVEDESLSIQKPCCPCHEAKYEMKFEGLWTRQSHPKGFPDNIWLTRFSDVIGATHAASYRFWRPSGYASVGLSEFSETGNTAQLEAEIKTNKTRTMIKAKGISYPNITGRTFAVFRADRENHLLSIVSMIRPSPDWFVGLSGFELCLDNCTWMKQRTLKLLPWDLGLYEDVTYNSRRLKNEKKERIQRINSSYPNEAESPFYNESGEEVKPLAKVYITLQRLYEKNNCSAEDDMTEEFVEPECEVTQWEESIPCNSTCGPGKRGFKRQYVSPESDANECRLELTKEEDCSENSDCGPNELPNSPSTELECEVGPWSEWSECSLPCGQRVKVRFREFANANFKKRCENSKKLQEEKACEDNRCPRNKIEWQSLNCNVEEWPAFSECAFISSQTCARQRSRVISDAAHKAECQALNKSQMIKCDNEECKKGEETTQ